MAILKTLTNISLAITVTLVAACAGTGAGTDTSPMMVAPAPITQDGHVAGRATDLVFVLESKADPAEPGLTLAAGDTLSVELPKAFVRASSVALSEDTDRNFVLTRGWPQGAVRLTGQYRIFFDSGSNAIGVRALVPIVRDGANAPGIKVAHLRGKTFVNPSAGEYAIRVVHRSADGNVRRAWSGNAAILAVPPDARLAPTNFHLPPGTNSDFQTIQTTKPAPHLLGLLLWDWSGSPMEGVGIAARDLALYPKYTGGLLVQDTNNDRVLDPKTDRVVGGIIGAAPAGARGQSALSPRASDGRPVLSGGVPRDAKYPGGGKPNPGLLTIEFTAGDKPGRYQPTIELIGGNRYQYTLIAR